MNRYLALLLLIALFFRLDPACSIFGAGDVPLEDYYEFGRHQTGVASVQTKKIRQGMVKTSFGTANLIDVEDIGIPSLKGLLGALKGRVLITAAHVVHGSLLSEGGFVRFMDENNKSQKMDIKTVYAHQDYDTNCNDIGLIILQQSVDTSKFKPLKLNLSEEEKSLSGELVNIFGCTPVFGKVTSNVVIREGDDTSLRRGMKTVVENTTNESLISYFYSSQGRVSIFRDSIQDFTESDKEKKHTIETELERLDAAVINAPQPSADHLTLTLKRGELVNERSNLRPIKVRGPLSWEFYYNGNSIEDQLAMLEDTDDLDKPKLISEWNKFINEKKSGNKSLDLGIYRIN